MPIEVFVAWRRNGYYEHAKQRETPSVPIGLLPYVDHQSLWVWAKHHGVMSNLVKLNRRRARFRRPEPRCSTVDVKKARKNQYIKGLEVIGDQNLVRQ